MTHNITSATYTERDSINVIIDGVTHSVPDDMGNRHRQMLAEWEAEGNTIAPYVALPVKQTPDPRTVLLDKMIDEYAAKVAGDPTAPVDLKAAAAARLKGRGAP